jgi:hypothetical protein
MSRRWAPYRIAAAGLASPLAEPDVRLSLRIRFSRRHGKVRRILHARRYRSTGVQQSTCCSADPSLQTRLVAWRLLGCLEPHSSLGVAFGRFLWSQVQTQADVPVESDKHAASAHTVAIIIRPSAGDGIHLPELFAKTDGDAITLRQFWPYNR